MPTPTSDKLALWRQRRERRRARTVAAELRRKPYNSRPGGNPLTVAAAYEIDMPKPVLAMPIPKHVPPNTHRVGSVAWSFFYRYILPGA